MDQKTRINRIRQEIAGLRTYAKADEIALLDQVAAAVADAKVTATSRTGEAELSGTAISELLNARKKKAREDEGKAAAVKTA